MHARAGRERPLAAVPLPLACVAALALAAQLLWHGGRVPPVAQARALPQAPSARALTLASLGEPVAAARLTLLWLQAFDDPPGVTMPLVELDYARLEDWLETIIALDPRARGPFLAAARIYASVPDPPRVRRMMALVRRHFLAAPNERWPWLAHLALVARHRLQDLPLALAMAREITARATGPEVPFWARDLTVLLLEDLCELESARVLVGGLLASGSITDAGELMFLERKLAALETAKGCPPRVERDFPALGR